MRKPFKYAAILFGTFLALFVLLSLIVNFYLTDERVRGLLIPRLMEATGRPVTMEGIQVSLLRGITIADFAVKEEDGITDFFRAKEFVLAYELLPLLRGRLIISEVALREPYVRVARDSQGRFNFETIAFLKEPPATTPREEDGVLLLPLALTIDQVVVSDARIIIEDQLQALPAVDGIMNASISVDTTAGLERLIYHGRYDFTAKAVYGQLQPQISGQGEFSSDIISYQANSIFDGQTVLLSGTAENWRDGPVIRLDLRSESLDIDHLLTLLGGAGLAAGAAPGRLAAEANPPAPVTAAPPGGMTASGQIKIAQARYQNLEMRDLTASYAFAGGILQINDLDVRSAGGKIVGSSSLDLREAEPAFSGALKMYSLQAGELAPLLSERFGSWLTGNLSGSANFAGRGSDWPQIKGALTGEAEYVVRNGQLREFPITIAVAELLGLPELRAFSFENFTGNLRVEKGQVLLNAIVAGPDIRAETAGTISMEGQMNLPVVLHFTGKLADKIKGITGLARYLTTAENGIAVNLRLTGPVSNPRPALDLGAAGERLRERVEEKILRELDRFLEEETPREGAPEQPEASPPARDFLKELLRR
jgi:AsmA protein